MAVIDGPHRPRTPLMPDTPIARIHLAALRHNLKRVRACAPDSQVLAVVKANAYGHGLSGLLPALQMADALAVARVDEAIALRHAGFKGRLVVLGGGPSLQTLQLAAEHDLELVIQQAGQLDLLQQASLARPLRCWLKVDTGMHRLGFDPQQIPALFARLQTLSNVAGPPVLMTHLANADVRDDPRSHAQLALFSPLARQLGAVTSIANSAGVLGWPASHGDWVRPGLMLYGASPFGDDSAAALGLRPVMTLTSRLTAIKHVRRGEAIGYGGSFICPEDMPIGVVGIGYGDGYPRELSDDACVLLHGRRVPVVGRVSMDMIMLDLRGQDTARIGDPLVLWGEGLPVDEVAAWANTIAYTLLCGVAGRVCFEIIDDHDDEPGRTHE